MPTVTPCKRKAAGQRKDGSPNDKAYADFLDSVADSPLASKYTEALESLQSMLYKNPDQIFLAQAFVKQKLAPPAPAASAASQASGEVDSTDWPNVEKAADIDKWYYWGWIRSVVGGRLTKELITKMDRKDRLVSRRIVERVAGIVDGTKIPQAGRDQHIFTLALAERHAQLGNPLQQLFNHVNTDTGVLDWGGFGHYALGDPGENGKIRTASYPVLDLTGVLPDHVTVDASWGRRCFWSLGQARLDKDKTPVPLASRFTFPVGTVQHRVLNSNNDDLKEICERKALDFHNLSRFGSARIFFHDGLASPPLAGSVPRGGCIWRGNTGTGSWHVNPGMYPSWSRPWVPLGADEACRQVLEYAWTLWLRDNALLLSDCPVKGVFVPSKFKIAAGCGVDAAVQRALANPKKPTAKAKAADGPAPKPKAVAKKGAASGSKGPA